MGEVLALTAGLCFSLSTMLTQRGMRQASASAGVMINLLVNNVIYAIFLGFLVSIWGLPTLNLAGVLYAVGGGIVGNVLGRYVYFSAVRRIGSARTILFTLTQTLFAFIWGIALLGEVLSLFSFLGIVLVVVGVYWLASEQVRRQSETSSPVHSAENVKIKRVSPGVLLALTAGLVYSCTDLLRRMSVHLLPSAVMASAIGGLFALVLQTLIFTLRGGWKEIAQLNRSSLTNLAMGGAAGGLENLALNAALGHSPLVLVNSLYNIRVWIAIAIGPVLLGVDGKITKVLVSSTLLILGGTIIVMLK